MESKNVKVIDEHSIDRTANIICSIDVDGTDYVVYWIERDADNDNLFVSKLIKNNDGTSNMMNIEDSMEKGKLVDIVKELITYAVNNEATKIDGNKVTLSNNKVVNISTVLFNKEQNINVSKTYITTVKKSVTKVSEDFYVVSNVTVNSHPEVQPFFESVVKEGVVDNVVNSTSEPVSQPEIKLPEIEPALVTPEMPVLDIPSFEEQPKEMPVSSGPTLALGEEFLSDSSSDTHEPEVMQDTIGTISDVPEKIHIIDGSTQVVPEQVMQPDPTVNVVPEVKEPEPVTAIPMVEAPQPETVSPKVEFVPPIGPGLPGYVSLQPEPAPVQETPVLPSVNPTVVENVNAPTDKLVFDASKETNLNVALGEVSAETPIPVNNVEPIREFGQDEPVIPVPASDSTQVVASETDTGTTSSMAGFANNKFFMVIAIAFFLASCVFLGYEVFRYFQIKG